MKLTPERVHIFLYAVLTRTMDLPIDRKMLLSICNAAKYSNISINKTGSMLRASSCPFGLYAGTKKAGEAEGIRAIPHPETDNLNPHY